MGRVSLSVSAIVQLAMQSSLRKAFTPGNVSIVQRCFASSAGSKQVKRATLENGVTLITPVEAEENTLGSVGVYVRAGSAFENYQNHGCAHYLRRFLFKGTNRASGLRITRTIENLAASFTAENHPEYLAYKATFPQELMSDVFAVMGDVLRPRLAEWEFREVRNLVKHDLVERQHTRDEQVLDRVRHTAFGGVGLGRSPFCPQYNVGQIYPEHVAEYILGHVMGSNITIVANVADHEQLVEAADRGFGALPKDASVNVEVNDDSTYIGGSQLVTDGPGSIYAEAYKGAAAGTKAAYAQAILAEILGSYTTRYTTAGNQVSSRLAKSAASNIEEATTFLTNDSHTLFGVRAYGSVPVRDLAENIHNQIQTLNQVTEEEFSRAKNVITARAAVQSSRRSEALDSLYRSSLLDSAEPFDITLQDVQNAAKELLSSKPTIYASGDLTGLPSFAY